MPQNDMVIANQGFAAFRSDLNNALQALASLSAGTGRPPTAYAGQLWLDTDTPSSTVWTLFLYDGTDDIEVGKIDVTNNKFLGATSQAADVASAATINLDTAYGDVVDVTGTTTITAPTGPAWSSPGRPTSPPPPATSPSSPGTRPGWCGAPPTSGRTAPRSAGPASRWCRPPTTWPPRPAPRRSPASGSGRRPSWSWPG
jgi:hypothetical protein